MKSIPVVGLVQMCQHRLSSDQDQALLAQGQSPEWLRDVVGDLGPLSNGLG